VAAWSHAVFEQQAGQRLVLTLLIFGISSRCCPIAAHSSALSLEANAMGLRTASCWAFALGHISDSNRADPDRRDQSSHSASGDWQKVPRRPQQEHATCIGLRRRWESSPAYNLDRQRGGFR